MTNCPACNANDRETPCAFPSGGQPGCLRDQRLWTKSQRLSFKWKDFLQIDGNRKVDAEERKRLAESIFTIFVEHGDSTESETNRTDVTHEAIGAVCEHAERFGKPITVNCNGEPKYRLIVERLSGKDGRNPKPGDRR